MEHRQREFYTRCLSCFCEGAAPSHWQVGIRKVTNGRVKILHSVYTSLCCSQNPWAKGWVRGTADRRGLGKEQKWGGPPY